MTPFAGQPARRHRSYTPVIVIGALVLVVVCAGLGTLGFLTLRSVDRAAAPPTPAKPKSAGPIYRALPALCELPQETVTALVPDSDEPLGANRPAGDRNHAHTFCHWDMSIAESKRRNNDRWLKVSMSAVPDDATMPGAEAARGLHGRTRADLEKVAGRTDGKFTYGPVEPFAGIGTDAFAVSTVTRSSFTYGGTTMHVLVDNVTIEISYGGYDGPSGHEVPMPSVESRQAAETAARAAVSHLTSCPHCRS
jgi:hypothetical protein